MVDPSIVGQEIDEVAFPVDRSKLAELARSYGDADPVWHDPQAAHAAGFEAVPTPPTVTVLVSHWKSGGVAGLADAIGAARRPDAREGAVAFVERRTPRFPRLGAGS